MTRGAQSEFSFGKFNTIRTLKEMITRSQQTRYGIDSTTSR
jgi:hypothetical protein